MRSVSAPVVRAILESGATWEDPSEDLLFMLLTDIEDGDETFVIVERPSDESGQTYAQVIRGDGGEWILERRDGDRDRHYRTTFEDLREAHATLTAWAFELPSSTVWHTSRCDEVPNCRYSGNRRGTGQSLFTT